MIVENEYLNVCMQHFNDEIKKLTNSSANQPYIQWNDQILPGHVKSNDERILIVLIVFEYLVFVLFGPGIIADKNT